PSIPHGNYLNPGTDKEEFLGAFFSNVKIEAGDSFTRPSAGGGGLGDPLKRKPEAVLEDIIDGYVSIERAKKDYGVIVNEIDAELDLYEIELKKTEKHRDYIRKNRKYWITEDTDSVYEKYQAGDIDRLDLVRHYGVVLDYATNKILEKSTQQIRDSFQERTVLHWD